MSRIARSDQPLYQTKGRPVSQLIEHRQPDGSPTDLTGSAAVARLCWAGVQKSLTVSDLGATGDINITGAASVTVDLPLGRVNEMWLTITDSQGNVEDIVYPVIGETP